MHLQIPVEWVVNINHQAKVINSCFREVIVIYKRAYEDDYYLNPELAITEVNLKHADSNYKLPESYYRSITTFKKERQDRSLLSRKYKSNYTYSLDSIAPNTHFYGNMEPARYELKEVTANYIVNNKIYWFRFTCSNEHFEKYKPVFFDILNNVRFD